MMKNPEQRIKTCSGFFVEFWEKMTASAVNKNLIFFGIVLFFYRVNDSLRQLRQENATRQFCVLEPPIKNKFWGLTNQKLSANMTATIWTKAVELPKSHKKSHFCIKKCATNYNFFKEEKNLIRKDFWDWKILSVHR